MADKTLMAEKARMHTEEMIEKYEKKIEYSSMHTFAYTNVTHIKTQLEQKLPEIILEPIDSVAAIIKYARPEETGCVLNFASYKNPGGQFINGSMAQEEALCHASFLFNVLAEHKDYYMWNAVHLNKGLYENRALYSRNILFNDKVYCDVLTCAAPNNSVGIRYHGFSAEENSEALKSRIKFLLDVADVNYVDTLILGAYGCGVFKQSPGEVAEIFKKHLLSGDYGFSKVIFAIPDENSKNYKEFEKNLRE